MARRHHAKRLRFKPLLQQPSAVPGANQVEDLWRWIAGLPANRDSGIPIATLRERVTRLEQHAVCTEPSQWRSPDLVGKFRFTYEDAPQRTFRWGFGASGFAFSVSGHGNDSVYVIRDYRKAVGVVRGGTPDDTNLERHLAPGRSVTPQVGQSVVLMNEHGRLPVVESVDVRRETTDFPYTEPHVTFRWRVLVIRNSSRVRRLPSHPLAALQAKDSEYGRLNALAVLRRSNANLKSTCVPLHSNPSECSVALGQKLASISELGLPVNSCHPTSPRRTPNHLGNEIETLRFVNI